MLLVDSHIHTELSEDSLLHLEEVVRNATERHLAGVCTADHFDPIPSDVRFAHYSPDAAIVQIERLRERYPHVVIGLGVEVTYREEAEDQIRSFLRQHSPSIDMAMGSVHDVEQLYVREWLAHGRNTARPLRSRLLPYITLLQKMSRFGLFDVLGHIDYVKRYDTELRSGTLLKLFETELAETLENQIAGGGIIEVNISGLRHPCREAYPSVPILELYREVGGRAVTIGSDAHALRHMDLPLSVGAEIARKSHLDIVDWRSFSGHRTEESN